MTAAVPSKANRGMRVLLAVLIAAALALPAAALDATPQPPQPTEGFVPVDQLPAEEQVPAAPLVMTAYAAAWLAVFAYLWSIWHRLDRVEREMAAISRRVEAGPPR